MSTEIKHYDMIKSSENSFIVTERHSIASSEKARVRFSPRVCFSPDVYCRATLTRYEYTYTEARLTWLFPDEKVIMMEDSVETTQRMKSGKRPKKNSTYRGLENMDARNGEEVKGIIHACVHAVLDEQDTHWEEHTCRWGPAAKISRICSRDNKALAWERARSDECEAKEAYRQMETDTDDISVHSTSSFSVESFQSPRSIMSRRNDVPSKILFGTSTPFGTPCSHMPETSINLRALSA
jgi:hypothetical protein